MRYKPYHARRAHRIFAAVVLLGVWPATGTAAETVAPKERVPELYEQGFDVTDEKIDRNRRTPVDVNSVLQLRFAEKAVVAAGGSASAPVGWQRVETILQEVRELAAERKAMNARVLSGPAAPGANREAVSAFNKKAAALIDRWEAAMRPGEAQGLQDVLTGELDGGNPSLPYENLARWLTSEIMRLQAENRAKVAGRLYEINVSAFLQHGTSQPKRIGVPGYDNIAIGSPEPISKTGLQLTAAEAAELDARLKITEDVAKLLRQIQDDWAETNKSFAGALVTLGSQIKRLPAELRRHTDSLNSLSDLREALNALAARADIDAGKKQAAARLLDACAKAEKDVQAFKEKISALSQVYQGLSAGADPAFLASLAGALGKFRVTAENLQKTAAESLKLINDWAARLGELAPDIEAVAPVIAEEKLAPLNELIANLKGTVATVQPIVDSALGIVGLLRNTNAFDKVTEGLADARIDEKWFKSENAPDTQIALDSVGLLPGDRLQVNVTYRSVDATPPASPVSFFLDTIQFGLHREIDATLIFARPLKTTVAGQAKRWRPNAAATAHWFYRHRLRADPAGKVSRSKKVWNVINPGIGIHAASLSQGDDSVEIGMGANVSLLNGMLSGGYGYNLSTEKPYVYVGIGLLEVLDRVRRPGAAGAGTGD